MKRIFILLSLWLISNALFGQNKPVTLEGTLDHQRIDISLSAGQNSVSLCNLSADESYFISVSSIIGEECNFELSRTAIDIQWSNFITFKATGSCENILIQFECPLVKTKEITLSISKTKISAPISSDEKVVLSTITTSQNGDATSLIQDVFIGGDCFDVEGVTYSGAAAGLGTFANGSSSINIEDGVIISTGNIGNSAGPNTSQSITTSFGTSGSDSDLDAISGGGALFDIAKIEFEFTPTEDQITFEYAFASDEYCEYAGTQFNDVFGFFISGPGINGPYSNNSDNIAIVPGTGDNVAINSVNHYTNVAYYLDNAMTEGCAGGSPVAPDDIEFDGFTTVLTAIANVIPCETYHIKLVIADRGDAIYDSAVFLKANSFGGELEATVSSEITGNAASDIAGYEGCSNAEITFFRVGEDDSEDLVINYTISSASTATPGADYEPFPLSVTIPAGQSSITITIEIFEDLIMEGLESIFIELAEACSCEASLVEIQILEPPPLEVIMEDIEICRDEITTLTPTIVGGIPPYTYEWSNGGSGESIDISVNQPQTLSVTVYDDCHLVQATVFTVYPTFPTAQISGEGTVCQGNSVAYLSVDLTGDGPWDIVYSINGNQVEVTGINYSPYLIIEDDPGNYELVSVTSADGCPGEVFGEVVIEEEILDVFPTINQISCFGQNDGNVQLETQGGTAPYTYDWDSGFPDEANVYDMPPGAYFVTVTDAVGCEGVIFAYIEEPEELMAQVTDLTNIDCVNTAGAISVEATGGDGPYDFIWGDGTTEQNLDNLGAGDYLLTVIDDSNCITTLEATIDDLTAYPDAVTDVEGELNCYSGTTSISSEGSSVGDVTYQWLSPGGAIIPGNNTEIDVSVEGFYTLVVTDLSNNCATQDTAEVILNNTVPVVQAGGDDILNCNISELWLDASTSDQGTEFTYTWETSDGNILSAGDSLFAQVNNPGTYTLSVLNTENGCSSSDEAIVDLDVSYPNVSVQPPLVLTCDVQELELTSMGSDSGTNFEYEWYSPDGTINSPSDTSSIVVSAAGTYELEITNNINGCATSLEVIVPIDTIYPIADAGDDIELDCLGTAVDIDGSGSSVGAEYTYEWSTQDGALLSGEQSIAPETAVAGTYTLVVTNTLNGCTSTDENIIINNTGALPLNSSAENILNCYNPMVQVSGEILDNTANYSVLWTSLEGNPIDNPESIIIDVVAPGTYSIEVTNMDNGCISIASVEVDEDVAFPVANAGDNQLINCYEPLTMLDASASDSGTGYTIEWTNPDGSIPAGSSELQLDTDLSGMFTLTVQNIENGCLSTDEVFVDADFSYPSAVAGGDMTLNCAIENVTLTGAANAGGDSFNFQWEDVQTNTILSTTSLNTTVDASGTYILSVFDIENGCVSKDTMEVFLDIEDPVANAQVDDMLNCDNAAVNLFSQNSSQGVDINYEWTNIDQNIIISSDASSTVGVQGNYRLIVTDTGNHCVDTAFVTVEQDIELPIVTIADPEVITCALLEVGLDPEGSSSGEDFVYNWTLPDGGVINQTSGSSINTGESGIYILEIVNTENGCESQTMAEVESLANYPIAEAGPSQLINCYNLDVSLIPDGSSIGNTFIYEWHSNGMQIEVSNTIQPLVVNEPGMYELIITDLSNDCVSLDTVQVDIDIQAPVAKAGPEMTLNCEAVTVNLDGTQSSAGNMSYQWTTIGGTIVTGINSQTPLISTPGTYSLLVTNLDNGCESVDEVDVEIDTIQPQLQILPADLLTCSVTSVTLEGNSDGTYTYNWINENDQIIGNNSSVDIQNPGTYEFVATNPGNHCVSSLSVEVDQNITPPNAEAGVTNTLTCVTTSLQLNASSSSGNAAYQWITTDGFIQSGATGLTPVINEPGTYTLIVTDNFNDCIAQDIVTIDEDIEVPIALAAPNGVLTCTNTSVELQGTSNNGLPLEFEWETISGQVINTGSLDATVTNPGVYQLTVFNPANGCDNSVEVMVEQDIDAPIVDAGEADDLTCIVTNLTLEGSVVSSGGGVYNYSWTGPDGGIIGNGNTANPIVQLAGTYTVQVTNEFNGCTDFDEVDVALIAPTGIEVEVVQPLCHGDPAFVEIATVEGGATPFVFSINAGGSFVQNNNFTLLSPGWHIVVVQDANGCEYTQGVEMIDLPEVEVELESLATIKLGESYQLSASVNIPTSEIASISWTPGDSLSCDDCLTPLATPYQTTDYLLQVVNKNGCVDEAHFRLIVDERPDIYIPNVFSPNADGVNEIFYIFAKENSIKNINSLQIFTRWGELVFEIYDFLPNDPQFGWDGFYRGVPMNSAVFVYWTEVELINGEVIILKGDVTIIR
jgi:gliding motility-associated-like protein